MAPRGAPRCGAAAMCAHLQPCVALFDDVEVDLEALRRRGPLGCGRGRRSRQGEARAPGGHPAESTAACHADQLALPTLGQPWRMLDWGVPLDRCSPVTASTRGLLVTRFLRTLRFQADAGWLLARRTAVTTLLSDAANSASTAATKPPSAAMARARTGLVPMLATCACARLEVVWCTPFHTKTISSILAHGNI